MKLKKTIDAEDLKNDLQKFLDNIRENDEIGNDTKAVQCATVRAVMAIIVNKQKGGKRK